MDMLKLFDKTFFKFLFGFSLIIVISFVILMATNYYDTHKNNASASTATPLK